MTDHPKAEPRHEHFPSTSHPIFDRKGVDCPRATPASYPLHGVCVCGALIRCADGTADWGLNG